MHSSGLSDRAAASGGAAASRHRQARPAPGERVYNFNAGPSMLPLSVLEQLREDLLNFDNLGAGVLEISHRSEPFRRMVEESQAMLRTLLRIPDNYRVLNVHGGGQLQFSMVPFNLIARKPARKALYIESGNFAQRAIEIGARYGYVHVPASSRETDFDRIPEFDPAWLNPEASYLHITTNNTAMGTRWAEFPDTQSLPLVGDMTSEILSRPFDVSRFGLVYAGAQKNLSPPGLALVIIREDLLGHALPNTPKVMDYAAHAADSHSMVNTPTSMAVYVMWRMLQWVTAQGGVTEMERRNEAKSGLLYDVLDASGGFYKGAALPGARATQNVTFNLANDALLQRFLAEAESEGLYALKGHSAKGGVRASLYNAMEPDGVKALVAFMAAFQQRCG